MKKLFPILGWIQDYNFTKLRSDAVAGLTVGTMLVPQGMAYALLAGLPPIAGLYASLGPLVIYPIFGTSRQLSVGPVAMDSLLVAAGVGMMAVQGTEEYLLISISLAFMVGIIQFLMGQTKLGFLVNFLSKPLINGFTSAAAVIIALNQLKHIFGMNYEGSQEAFLLITRMADKLSEIHPLTFGLGICCVLIIYVLKKFRPTIPSGLVAIALSTATVWMFDLQALGIQIIGEVPQGLPSLSFPKLDFDLVQSMFPIAITIAFISYMEAIAVSKAMAEKKGYTIDANQELTALGLANMSAGLSGGYPIAGSFSRTAVNGQAGAKTAISSVFSLLILVLTLLFLTPLFYYMPNAVLAAIVLVAIIGLIDIKEPKRLFRVRKQDFVILVFAFAMTLIFGAKNGIILGAIGSLILIIRRISSPSVAVLGRIPGTSVFRNISRVPEAQQIEGLMIFRIDASLYFANSTYLKDKIQKRIAESKDDLRSFAIDCTSVNEIDSTAVATLAEIAEELKSQEIELYFSSVKAPVKEIMDRAGFSEKIGIDKFFFSKPELIAYHEKTRMKMNSENVTSVTEGKEIPN